MIHMPYNMDTCNTLQALFATDAAPPVTKTEIPARAASSMVADTVVEPSSFLAMTYARSRLEVFWTFKPF